MVNKKRTGAATPRTHAPTRTPPVQPATVALASAPGAGVATRGDPGFAIVGIGASAGGLDAFKQFFAAMTPDADLAFVLIQHLDPTHQSLTAELLTKHTAMRVVQVEDEMHVAPNHVYVIPPNRYLSISGETLHLTEPAERRGVRVPIDFFFRSLADDQRERAIAIVLTGTGSDGALGVREIKAGGGMVMVQAPDTAQHDGMPRSAIATGVADYVLPVASMPATLVRYVRHSYVNRTAAARKEPAADPLGTIVGELRVRLKYDFSCYKRGTLTRRVQRRMGLRHLEDMAAYIEVLRQDKDEVHALYKDLLIGVTNFFREPESWRELETLVIEPLVARVGHASDAPDTIRVWTPGCATGEEPYSIAMLLAEKLAAADRSCAVSIFASDIDQDALAFARAGAYPNTIEADVAADRLHHFFRKGEHTWRIDKRTREVVVFAEQNVISDPPFSKLDLISCRNLLIYLEPEIQKKILSMFHFALREGGYLFLGNAETIYQQADLFETISRKHRIYRRLGKPVLGKPVLGKPVLDKLVLDKPVTALLFNAPAQRTHHLAALAQQAVMERFAPACVLVNRKAEVLYLCGPVDDYLQLPSGEASHDLIAMTRPGLRTKLRAAFHAALSDEQPVTLENVAVKRGQKYFPIRVTIEPLRQANESEALVLIAFDEVGAESRARVVHVVPSAPEPTDRPETAAEYEAVIRHLDGELSGTREDLQSAIEELETSNEEFKAANEEIMSVNEELQSTNEELETSKEELQSLNEELQTVNSQLESKVGELEQIGNDLVNLLTSTDIATLFLDRQLRLRRFTPAATRMFRIRPSDVGRPLADFSQYFVDTDLLTDAQRVIEHLAPIEKEVQDVARSSSPGDLGALESSASHWYARRILPYRTDDDRIDGVVITFADITSNKEYQHILETLNRELDQRVAARTTEVRRFSRVFQEAAVPIIIEDLDGFIVEMNQEAELAYGWSRAELIGRLAATLVPPEQHQPLDNLIQRCRKGHPVRNIESWRVEKDGRRHPVLLTLTLLSDEDGRPSGIATVAKDLTERLEIEKRVSEQGDQERQYLGRALHDTLGQQISAMALLVAGLRAESAGGMQDEITQKLEATVNGAKHQLRAFMKGLVPVDVDAAGLRLALDELATETSGMHALSCRFESTEEIHFHDSFVAAQLYMIAREAVHNAVKHADADKIAIRLGEDDGIIRLTISDDGRGTPANVDPRLTMGLRIMRHRCGLVGGTFTLESPPAGGTVVSCSLRRP